MFGRALIAVMGMAMAGCGFQPGAYDGTAYQCAAVEPRCPPGYTCDGDRCVRGGGDGPDARIDSGPGPDAALVTVTFGERPDADHQGVTRDTTISDADPNTNLGGDDNLAIDASPIKVTLMRVDLAAIPRTATVVAAQLDLDVWDPLESGTLRLDALGESWTEDGATFVDRAAGTPWTAAGAQPPSSDPTRRLGEIDARDIAPTTITLEPTVVQTWVSFPETNYGFAWFSTSPDGHGTQVRSREYADASLRPLLRVTYAP